MRLLLDTHVLLWLRADSPRLSEKARETLVSAREVVVSTMSLAEIAVKASVGKLDVPDDFYSTMDATGVAIEAFGVEDAAVLASLPLHHRDPFDRMLVAQAIRGRMTLVSADPRLRAYDVPVVS